MTEDQIKHMAEQFLRWKLPADFFPDCGITFDSARIHKTSWPTGTNLLSYTQASAMVRHMVEKMPAPKPNPERLQKRCEACCGTGRTDSGDDCYQRCDMCGGEGMLP